MRKFILAIAFWVATALPAWAESQEIETTIRDDSADISRARGVWAHGQARLSYGVPPV